MGLFKKSRASEGSRLWPYIVAVIVSVVVIVWFMPRTSGPQWVYKLDMPWLYGDLIAETDFAVEKSDESIKEERDSIEKAFVPYYNKQVHVGLEQVARFDKDYPQGVPGVPATVTAQLKQRLSYIYSVGLLTQSEYARLHVDSLSQIRIVEGRDATITRVGNIFSRRSAYEYLYDDPLMAKYRSELQRCDLDSYLESNLAYDSEKCEAEKLDILSTIATASGVIKEGEKIIDRGEIVDDYKFRALQSYQKVIDSGGISFQQMAATIVGQVSYVLLIILAFTTFIILYRRDYLYNVRNLTMLYVMISVFPVVASLFMRHHFFSVYVIPFAMVAIFVRIFLDSRTAFMTHMTMTLIAAGAVKYQYDFIIIQLLSGLVAAYSLRELTKRTQIYLCALLVVITQISLYVAIQLMQLKSNFSIDMSMINHCIISGFLVLLSYPLMLIVEKMFGYVSNVTLFELTDTNKKLLRELSINAPGTFQHSIMVGNLAAEIASKIGAKALLVRVGALYHDIGKMKTPVYFTENQREGVNPYEGMSHIDSARMIKSHVAEGVRLAEEHGLPEVIKNFIRTHHGTSLTKFFYINFKNEHPDEEIDEDIFRYSGPNPTTAEQAILMMADATEAASRSLKEYTEESISTLVNNIIDSQVREGYFNECPITFRDIFMAKQVLIDRLVTIYHTRVAYPTMNKPDDTEQEQQDENKDGLNEEKEGQATDKETDEK